MKPRYAALCCYFGKWPNYFQFWLSSCRYNQGIDFFLVSDISVDGYDVPTNVHIIKKNFEDVRSLINSKFPEIEISLERPYKLCDFKVAYGYIFSDLFEGYDYWGYFDIDTIWGNILKFIPQNDDSHLIKIFPCGHLCFIRNVQPYKEIFRLVDQVVGTQCMNNMAGKEVVSWKQCFSSSSSYYYDEEGGLEPLFSARKDLLEHSYQEVDFDNILPPWRFDHFLSINFPEKSHNLVYSFLEGHLYRHYLQQGKACVEEISYIHVSKRKFSISAVEASAFVVYPNRFASYKAWTVLGLRCRGRNRYLINILRRITGKLIRKQ